MRRIVAFGVRAALVVVCATLVLLLPWRWAAPPTSAFMVRDRLAGAGPLEYRWVPMGEISPYLAVAAIAAEDQKFPTHRGFDLVAIAEALEENASETGSIRGGSTISQQVAKNLFLWPTQSFVRKGAEAWLTVWIELLWPKQRILEVYLNVAEFGPGVYGAEAASGRAFGKPASALTLREAARLVAVLPSPRRMSIVSPSAYVESRTGEIIAAVEALGGVTYLGSLGG